MSPDERLEDAQDAWQVAFEAGHDRPVAELLPDAPDLQPELERRVAILRRMLVANQPPVSMTQDPPTITARSPQDTVTGVPHERPTIRSPVSLPLGFMFERELGRGGMGVVYLARQAGLNRLSAVKMILDAAGPSAVIRFLAEAETVASVKHPNVVEVYQFGEHDGKPYLALEFCAGGDLTGKTKGGRTDARQAAELMAAVADGVNAAHSAGIVHRDLKPGNILLAADGTPKVSDFGLAKKGGGAELTGSEAVLGTAAYMSPEQAGGGTKFVGPECDVWALGVMLYELLAGVRPFAGPSFLDYRIQILGRQLTPLRQAFPHVPRDLELIVAKCLCQEPRERYATAGGLAADLRNWLIGRPISVRPLGVVELVTRWAQRNPTKLVASSLAVLVGILGMGIVSSTFSWHAAVIARDDAVQERVKAESARQETDEARGKLAAFQYGGVLRVAHREWQDRHPLAARQLLYGTDSTFRHWEWRYLDKLVRAPLPRIADTEYNSWQPHSKGTVRSVAFSPDGSRILSASDDGTTTISDAESGKTVLTLELQDTLGSAAFSPDGKRILTSGSKFIERLPDTNGLQLWRSEPAVKLWDTTTGSLGLTIRPRHSSAVAFSPDGTRVVTVDSFSFLQIWDAWSGQQLNGLRVQVGTENRNTADEAATEFNPPLVDVNPDGTRVALASRRGCVKVINIATGAEEHTCDGHAGPIAGLSFSPNGACFVTASEDKTAKVWDAGTGKHLVTLAGDTASLTGVVWSPDGERIVTASDALSEDSDGAVRVWDARSGAEVLTLRVKALKDKLFVQFFSLAWSRDGTRIAAGSGGGKVYVWDCRAISKGEK